MKKRGKNQRFFHYNFFSKNHKGIATEYLPWLIIAILVLVILMVTIFVLRAKGTSLVDAIKGLLRIG